MAHITSYVVIIR